MNNSIIADIRENLTNIYETTLKVAMDIGKSDTKVACGETEIRSAFKFPTVIDAPNVFTMYGASDLFSTSLITDKGDKDKEIPRSYFVGTTGCKIHTTTDNAKDGRGGTKENNHDKEIAILCGSLGICMAMEAHGVHTAYIKAAMGMPIIEFSKYQNIKDGLTKYFGNILPIGREVVCSYNGEEYRFTITEGRMFPETLSAYLYGQSFNNETRRLILVDIGGNNIQYVLSTDTGISDDETLTFTDKHGVNEFLDNLLTAEEGVDALNKKAVSKAMLQEWLTDPTQNPLTGDKRKRFDDCYKKAAKEYLETNIFDVLKRKYADYREYNYKIIYTGGGAMLFKNILGEGRLLPDGEFANVKGFYSLIH